MGMDVDKNGEILSLKSKKNQLSGLANGGVYLIDPRVLSSLDYKAGNRASLEEDLLLNYISKGRKLFGKEFNGRFVDIGLPEDYHQSSKIIKQ